MSKLLSANLMRLKKNRLFWLGMLLMFAFGAVLVFSQYRIHTQYGYDVMLDTVLLGFMAPIGVIMAVFCSLFTGTEYSDGTIRNKLIVGHSRPCIYAANLITAILAALLLCAACLLALLALGIPLLGAPVMGEKTLFWMFLGCFVLTVTFSALFTMIAMVCSSKAAVAIISILLILAMFLISTYLFSALEEPEFYNNYYLDASQTMQTEYAANPNYVSGWRRNVFEFMTDFLPTGQVIQYCSASVLHLWQLPLYALLIAAGTTVFGVLVFRRKDIK